MAEGRALRARIASLKRAICDDIIPLLEEYCYEDYGTLGSILGEDLVELPCKESVMNYSMRKGKRSRSGVGSLLRHFHFVGSHLSR